MIYCAGVPSYPLLSWRKIAARRELRRRLAARARRFAVTRVSVSTQTELDLVLGEEFVQRMADRAVAKCAEDLREVLPSVPSQPDDVMEALFLYEELNR